MPNIDKTSELMSDGTLRAVEQPKFKIGEEVNVVGKGRTGSIVMSEPYTKRYLVDCYPGALGGYDWVWMKTERGPELLALNWFNEKQLSKLRKKKK